MRTGAAQAVVGAEFTLADDHPAHAILAAQGVADEGDTLLLRRVVGADGRGRAYVNDQPASVGLLKRLGETLVEIQGQFEQHGLLVPVNHRDTPDAFGGFRRRRGASRGGVGGVARGGERPRRGDGGLPSRRNATRNICATPWPGSTGSTPGPTTRRPWRRSASCCVTARRSAMPWQALEGLERDKGVIGKLSAAHRLIER